MTFLEKYGVIISQLRGDRDELLKDRDRLLKAFDDMRSEIEKLQTYKMFIGEKTVYVERDDVLAVIDKHKEVRGNNADSN
jgi:hypothetical protein